jgi:hypothetical protein
MIDRNRAKTLWCPHARGSMGQNRTPEGKPYPGSACLAEGCFAWRASNADENLGWCEIIDFPMEITQCR